MSNICDLCLSPFPAGYVQECLLSLRHTARPKQQLGMIQEGLKQSNKGTVPMKMFQLLLLFGQLLP